MASRCSGFASTLQEILVTCLLLIYLSSIGMRASQLLSENYTWPTDFPTYYFSSIALVRGLDIYSLPDLLATADSMGYSVRFTEYVYPPLLAALTYPLTLIRLPYAFVLWILFNQALLVVAILLYHRLSGGGLSKLRARLLIFLLFLPSLFYGSSSGQVTPAILFLFVAYYWAARRKMPRLAGFSLGLSAMIKPVSLVFYPYLLFKKEFKTLSAAIATDAALLAFSALACGPATMKRFAGVMLDLYFSSTSFESFIFRLDSGAFLVLKVAVTLVFLAILYLACRKVSGRHEVVRFGLEYSFLMASILVLTPRMQYYNYTYLIPAFWILYDRRHEIFPGKWTMYAALLLFMLIISPTPYVSLYAVVCLWLLLLYLLIRTKKTSENLVYAGELGDC